MLVIPDPFDNQLIKLKYFFLLLNKKQKAGQSHDYLRKKL
ncbi:hypothetical protein AB751O23_AM_00050 [Chlamydiales bacterium SCGC AB-751-O23]|nr:hypothetical protein AB751O23_AM_00050 [Chlamydiales bacterium SCGC AB-751-O23]